MKTDTEKAKEAKREYMRQWRAKNKEKNKETQLRYWLKKFNQSLETGTIPDAGGGDG